MSESGPPACPGAYQGRGMCSSDKTAESGMYGNVRVNASYGSPG